MRHIRPRHRLILPIALAIASVAFASSLICAAEEVRVAAGYDKTAFNYRIELEREHDSFRVYRVTYPSPVLSEVAQNNTVPGELYLPKDCRPGTARRPAVICMHILGGGFELIRLQCTAL